jgi:pimeloyl-ACP methyl ester carboxylesterase
MAADYILAARNKIASPKRHLATSLLVGVGIDVAILAGLAVRRYQIDMAAAQASLNALDRRTVTTSLGPVEYVEVGAGPPVLIVHGVFGGCDHGLLLTDLYVGRAFRTIVPSRFGYLGSPLPSGATPADQAKAFVELLDQLNIEKVAVVGFSAGSTSSVELTLRHPERVSALVLVSPNAPWVVKVHQLRPEWLGRFVFRRQFAFWLWSVLAPSSFEGMAGIPKGYVQSDEDRAIVTAIMGRLFPMTARAEGNIYDSYVSNPAISNCPLEEIRVPTVVIHSADDPLSSYGNARPMAERIPMAELITRERGGHLGLGDGGITKAAVTRFITEHAKRLQ